MNPTTKFAWLFATAATALLLGCAPAYRSYSGCYVDCQYCPSPPLPYRHYDQCVCQPCPAQTYLHVDAPATERAPEADPEPAPD